MDESSGGLITVEGYVVERRLGTDAIGSRWLGHAVGSDMPVEFRRIGLRTENSYAEARRLLEIQASIRVPGLLRLVSVVPTEDRIVLVSEHGQGGSLADLLAARELIDPGEAATIVSGLSPGLAAAHARGVQHGRLVAESIRFDTDGRPVLADVGLRGLLEETPGTPADDVFGLAAAIYLALSDRTVRPGERHYPLYQVAPGVPSGLALAVESALNSAPGDRPDIPTFAAQVAGSAPRTPLRIPVPAPPPEPPAPRVAPDWQADPAPAERPRGRRTALLWGGGGVALLAAAALVVTLVLPNLSGGNEPRPTPSPTSSAAATPSASTSTTAGPMTAEERRWRTLITTFDNRRMQAFGKLDPKALASVDAPKSPAMTTDQATMEELRKAGYEHAWRVRLTVRRVKIMTREPDRVVLDVSAVPWQYVLQKADGKRISGPKRPPARFRVTLARVDGDGPWRWYQTQPVDSNLPAVPPNDP